MPIFQESTGSPEESLGVQESTRSPQEPVGECKVLRYIPSGEDEEDSFIKDLSAAIIAYSSLPPNDAAERIRESILASWDKNSKVPRVGASHVSWWTSDCQNAKDAFLLNRSQENLQRYNAATKAAKSDFFNRKIDLMTANNAPWEGV